MVSRALSAASVVEVHNDQFRESNRPESPGETRWQKCSKFGWDSKEKRLCEITPYDWARIIFLYSVFLGIVSSICIGTYVFGGKFIGYSGKENLGIKSPTITALSNDSDVSRDSSVMRISDSLKTLNGNILSNDSGSCFKDNYNKSYSCRFDWNSLGPCSRSNSCIYLTLNKYLNWSPECFDVSELPEEILKKIQPYTEKISEKNQPMEAVWLDCQGYNPSDVEHLGRFQYYPIPGWEAKYFPFNGNENYLQPIVGLFVPEVARRTLISIKCHVWAKNMDMDQELLLQVYFNAKNKI